MEQILESLNLDKALKQSLQEAFTLAVKAEADVLVSEKESELALATDAYKNHLEEKIDEYLDRVVDRYLSENKIAIDQEIKAAKLDALIEGFDSLLTIGAIDLKEINTEKREISDNELQEAVDTRTNVLVKEIFELKAANAELLRLGLIKEAAEGMTELQKEKLLNLTDLLEFDAKAPSKFLDKVSTIKESILSVQEKKQEPMVESVKDSKVYKAAKHLW